MTKWDKKAKDYTRYSEKKDRFENRVFDTLASLHVEFKNRKILDIGCGTGVYTLHIAKKALLVDGIDSSKEMLEILKKDAKTLGLSNIETKTTTWLDFMVASKYDFALCTMSPAISSHKDLEKMDNCAKTKIYLGWAGKRDTLIMQRLFEAHDSIYSSPNGSKKVKKWLNCKNRLYQVVKFDEKKVRKREFEKAVANFEWHLEVRGVKPDTKKIRSTLKEFCDKDNTVIETTKNHFNLIVWR